MVPMTRLLIVLLCAASAAAQYQETITVSRVLLDVRVTEAGGEPIADLQPADFTIRIGGQPARVVSAKWVDDVARAAGAGRGELPDLAAPQPGRLFVALVQTDFQRVAQRVRGQMKFHSYAADLIESFGPYDRVAVFSFDSHLKFRRDFTADKADAAKAVAESILLDSPPPPPAVEEPSLAPFLEREAMKRAASSEQALLVIANALGNIDGPKTLLLCGWGLGERYRGFVAMRREWAQARAALLRARVTILAFDTTEASNHDLAAALALAANETGGFYASTNELAQQAVNRAKRSLRGRYELELIADDGRAGTHPLDVRVRRRGAFVLAPSTISIAAP